MTFGEIAIAISDILILEGCYILYSRHLDKLIIIIIIKFILPFSKTMESKLQGTCTCMLNWYALHIGGSRCIAECMQILLSVILHFKFLYDFRRLKSLNFLWLFLAGHFLVVFLGKVPGTSTLWLVSIYFLGSISATSMTPLGMELTISPFT